MEKIVLNNKQDFDAFLIAQKNGQGWDLENVTPIEEKEPTKYPCIMLCIYVNEHFGIYVNYAFCYLSDFTK